MPPHDGATLLDFDVGACTLHEQAPQSQCAPVGRQTGAEDQMVFAQTQTAETEQERLERPSDTGAKVELIVGRRFTERPERLLGVGDEALPQWL